MESEVKIYPPESYDYGTEGQGNRMMEVIQAFNARWNELRNQRPYATILMVDNDPVMELIRVEMDNAVDNWITYGGRDTYTNSS